MTLKALCPAKINLGLWIHARRPDGFHELSTVFQEIPITDELTFEPNQPTALDCPEFPGPDNLVEKARAALEAHCQRPLPGAFALTKHIPAQAGLGGGSSDGAAALGLLNCHFKLNLTALTLEELAATIGSDTSFFIRRGCQLGRGRGEHLEIVEGYKGLVLIGIPEFGLSTADVFRELKPDELTTNRSSASMVAQALEENDGDLSSQLHNDLTAPALRLEPRLKPFLNTLADLAGSTSWLSGSGSSCFALPTAAPEPPTSFGGRLLVLCDTRDNRVLWTVQP